MVILVRNVNVMEMMKENWMLNVKPKMENKIMMGIFAMAMVTANVESANVSVITLENIVIVSRALVPDLKMELSVVVMVSVTFVQTKVFQNAHAMVTNKQTLHMLKELKIWKN